jgi:hypothetical protein
MLDGATMFVDTLAMHGIVAIMATDAAGMQYAFNLYEGNL